MATISLYASKINHMPELLKASQKKVNVFQDELRNLNKKILKVDNSVCDVYNEAGIVQTSVNTQKVLAESIGKLNESLEKFIDDTVNTDNKAVTLISQQKKDFYQEYSYLKPECEKSTWEKVKSGFKKAGEWCREHWKLLTTVVLVIAAVVVIVATAGTALGPVAALLVAAAKGLIIGSAIGGLTGGIFSVMCGRSFFEGFEEGAFSGAISGAVAGGLCSWFSGSGEIALSLGKQMTFGGLGDMVASVFGDVGDIAINGKKLSVLDVLFDAGFSFAVGALATGITSKLSNYFPLKIKGINKGRGSWEHVWKTQSIRSLRNGTRVQIKTIMKGFGADFVNGIWDYGFEFPKNLVNEIREAISD